MAMLTEEQWAEVRAEWERDPRPALGWLIVANGGRWDISEEPIRRRRKREDWQKVGQAARATPANRAAFHRTVDATATARREIERPPEPVPAPIIEAPPPEPERPAVVETAAGPLPPNPEPVPLPPPEPVRAEHVEAERLPFSVEVVALDERRRRVTDRHRQEWNVARRLLYRAMGLAETKAGQDMMRAAVSALQGMTLLQAGESKAWGLDASFINYSALTEEELQKLVKAG